MAKKVRTMDLTPTWVSIAPIHIEALMNGGRIGTEAARKEIMRMAEYTDKFNELNKYIQRSWIGVLTSEKGDKNPYMARVEADDGEGAKKAFLEQMVKDEVVSCFEDAEDELDNSDITFIIRPLNEL